MCTFGVLGLSCEILAAPGPHPLRAPTLRSPTLRAHNSGPPLRWAPPSGPQLRAPTLRGPHQNKKLAKCGLEIRSTKIGQIRPNKVGQMRPVNFGQMWYWPNVVLAKCGQIRMAKTGLAKCGRDLRVQGSGNPKICSGQVSQHVDAWQQVRGTGHRDGHNASIRSRCPRGGFGPSRARQVPESVVLRWQKRPTLANPVLAILI